MMRNRYPCIRKEGKRQVYRQIDLFDIFALKEIAMSFDTIRSSSVVKRCDEIIALNNDADFNKIKTVIID